MTPGFTVDTEESKPFARGVYTHAQMSFAVRVDFICAEKLFGSEG